MVRCFGFTLKIPGEICIFLPVCRAYGWPYIASILWCRVTRYGLRSSCRYSLTWNTQTWKSDPLQVCVRLTPGRKCCGVETGGSIRCSTIAERCLTWHALFFPILEAAVRVGNCRLVLTQWNGFSIKAKSKERCLRECAVCIHIRAMSRLHREKKQWMKRLGWLAEPLID